MQNLDSIELGRIIGTGLQNANQYKDDFVESEEVTDINLTTLESINLSGSYFVYKNPMSTTSFVLDHPVYGELDSSTLLIDGGYAEGTATFPITFPITFIGGVELFSSGTL